MSSPTPDVVAISVGIHGSAYDLQVSPSGVVLPDGTDLIAAVSVCVQDPGGQAVWLEFDSYDEAERFGLRLADAVRDRREGT